MKYLLLLILLCFAACTTAAAQHNPYLIINKRCVTIYHGAEMFVFRTFPVVKAVKSKDGYWVFKLADGKVTSFAASRFNSILIEDITKCAGRR